MNTYLSDQDVSDILSRLASGEKQRVLAAEYGITQGSISRYKTGRRRRTVPHGPTLFAMDQGI